MLYSMGSVKLDPRRAGIGKTAIEDILPALR
jgi:hypothetical protein